MKYAIGKATRNRAGEVLDHLPYDIQGRSPNGRYEALRATLFDSESEALAAAEEATQYNPVGFVVVRVALPQPEYTDRQLLETALRLVSDIEINTANLDHAPEVALRYTLDIIRRKALVLKPYIERQLESK